MLAHTSLRRPVTPTANSGDVYRQTSRIGPGRHLAETIKHRKSGPQLRIAPCPFENTLWFVVYVRVKSLRSLVFFGFKMSMSFVL